MFISERKKITRRKCIMYAVSHQSINKIEIQECSNANICGLMSQLDLTLFITINNGNLSNCRYLQTISNTIIITQYNFLL